MNSTVLTTKNIVKIAILGALSGVLMTFRFPLPFAPAFLDFDLAEVPGLLGSFAMGPAAGFIIVLIKIFIKYLMSGTGTAFVGELSNIVVNGTLIVVAGLYYKYNRTFKGAIVAMILAVIAMTLVATLSNYFVMFPLYSRLFGISMENLIEAGAAVNPLVFNYESLMLFTIVPFNLIKGLATALVTTLIYPRVSSVLKRGYR